MSPFSIEGSGKGFQRFQGFQRGKGSSFAHCGIKTGIMEITDKGRRRLLKEYWAEISCVEALRHRIGIADAKCRADFFIDHGYWPSPLVLPSLPVFPPECVGMICGGKGRRSGRPCQCKEIYPNGRCKWHGGASTGPKTAEGKALSQSNLRRGSKS
jgi:hypothetical protein